VHQFTFRAQDKSTLWLIFSTRIFLTLATCIFPYWIQDSDLQYIVVASTFFPTPSNQFRNLSLDSGVDKLLNICVFPRENLFAEKSWLLGVGKNVLTTTMYCRSLSWIERKYACRQGKKYPCRKYQPKCWFILGSERKLVHNWWERK